MRGSKKSQYTDIDDRVIYILLSPETNDFFLSHCNKKIIKNLYRQHLCGYYYKTKKFSEGLKTKGLRPCLFILEEIRCTKVEAFNYVIVWTKIFLDAGFMNLTQGNVMEYKDNLLEKNIPLYEKRKNFEIEKFILCKNCRVQNYNRKQCKMFRGE